MDNPEIKYQKGIVILREGKYDEALNIFNQLVADFPSEADYWSERGVIHFHLKNKKLALADMDRAIELQPVKSYRYSSRAYIRGHYKMTNEAIEDYKKAIELDPEDAVALNNLGLMEEQLGYKKQANQRFEMADKLMGDDVDGRSEQGINGEELKARNIQKEIDLEQESKSLWSELMQIATKEGRESFVKFLKSGFKKP